MMLLTQMILQEKYWEKSEHDAESDHSSVPGEFSLDKFKKELGYIIKSIRSRKRLNHRQLQSKMGVT
jgi:hypothetical protein